MARRSTMAINIDNNELNDDLEKKHVKSQSVMSQGSAMGFRTPENDQ